MNSTTDPAFQPSEEARRQAVLERHAPELRDTLQAILDLLISRVQTPEHQPTAEWALGRIGELADRTLTDLKRDQEEA